MIEVDLPGGRAVFTTREGGVSEGAYESLNLGILTDDEPPRVIENRRRTAAAAGLEPERIAMAWQVHGAELREWAGPPEEPTYGLPGATLDRVDGHLTSVAGLGLLVLAADCLPVALARNEGPPALAVLHAGWKGLLAGIVAGGAAALGGGRLAAIVGPAIGPCCYEVGPEVAGPFAEAFGADVVSGRSLDLPLAAERALRATGVETVEQTGLCTSCHPDLFFSHRRDGGQTGRQGVLAHVA